VYLLIAICGGFAFFAGYEDLTVAGDATATANKIVESQFRFRLEIAIDSLLVLGEMALNVLLYIVFKPVSKTLSMVAACSRLAMTAMIDMNVLNKLVVLQLLSDAE
jgi:hypothetical protein